MKIATFVYFLFLCFWINLNEAVNHSSMLLASQLQSYYIDNKVLLSGHHWNDNVCIAKRDSYAIHCDVCDSNNLVHINNTFQGINDLYVSVNGSTNWASVVHYFNELRQKPNFISQLIHIWPSFGSVVVNDLNVTTSVSPSQYDAVVLDVEGVTRSVLSAETLVHNHILSSAVEPASWFFTLTPARTTSAKVVEQGYPSFGYIEFVLSEEQIREHRRFRDINSSVPSEKTAVAVPAAEVGLLGASFSNKPSYAERVNVCVWSSVRMDGQKTIWLQQSEFLDRHRFQLVWIVSLSQGESLSPISPHLLAGNSVLKHVLRLQREGTVRVVDSPYNAYQLQVEDLYAVPEDGSAPASDVWGEDLTRLYKYAHDRLVAAFFDIDAVSPAWCRQFYQTMREVLLRERCDVVVFGNSRLFSSDVFITDTARLLGLPTVAELLNLYIDIDVMPDVVVGPSTYAVEHESVRGLANFIAQHQARSGAYDHVKVPLTVIIPPSVDAETRFNPQTWFDVKEGLGSDPYFHVGFVARLAPEKSPGLFLMAAAELLALHPFARFTVIGDGELRQSLEALARRLRISWAVTFLGWVDEALPSLLLELDVVVNPSLRAWAETFCIANIEAMSMGVPLVTFAVGGVGEYVAEPLPLNSTQSSQAFSLSSNAVVVHSATPLALAKAVHFLVTHPEDRWRIGAAGRETVRSYFNVQRQMGQYAELYSHLARSRHSS